MPSEADLKEKARAMVLAMQERARWIYALPGGSFVAARTILEDGGAVRVDEADQGKVLKYETLESETNDEQGRFVLFDQAALDVVLLQAEGGAVVPLTAKVLEATGFVPQSRLWGEALAVGPPEAGRALRILAHMAVAWDDDWTDVFLLHLASPDPIARHAAALALTVAAMVAGTVAPAMELLAEARRRETFPRLCETLDEAARILGAFDGRPLDLGALEPPDRQGA
jgi:hypothetical protein